MYDIISKNIPLENNMTRFFRKFIPSVLIILIISGICAVSSFAANGAELTNSFKTNDSKIICVAHRGDWHSYPENSAEAVRAAAEYGVVSVDVKVTQDGEIVLMADDTTERMCVDADGKTVSGFVSNYTLESLQEMYLRSANGTVKNEKTEFHPASLAEAVSAAGSDTALMLNLKCADFEAVYNKVKALDIADSVIFRFSDKNKEILKTVSGKKDITVCGNYQGNIIFLATSAVKNSFANGINTVELGSKNGHGVLYDNFLMKRFASQGKAMVSMTGGRCGKRTDNETGWDDLISRGYSVIETDYPAELTEYIEKTASAKAELERYLNLCRDTDTKPFTTDTENAFISAVDEADKLLDGSVSLSQLENARYNLQSSFDNLTVGAKKAVTLSFNLTAGRVIAAVLCGAAVLGAQIFLYKKREKKN